MNCVKSPHLLGWMLLFAFFASFNAVQAADDLHIGFDEKDKLRLTDMNISGWKASQRDGDAGRILLTKKASDTAEVLIDINTFTSDQKYDHLILRAFIHGDYRPNQIGRIEVNVSEDGVKYIPVKLKAQRESKHMGGWYRYRLTATNKLIAFRYIKLHIRKAPVYWKIELADLWLGKNAVPKIHDPKIQKNTQVTKQKSSLLPDGKISDIAIPNYQLTIKKTGPTSTTVNDILVCPLNPSDEQLHIEALNRYPWTKTQIFENHFRSPTWNSHKGLKIAKDVQAVLYRFHTDLANWPGQGKLQLELDQCAFVTTLWVNGKKGPTIREGFLPIAFDLTPYINELKKDQKLDVVLHVQDYHNQIDLARNYPKMPLGAMFKWTKGIVMPPRLTWQAAVATEKPFVFSDITQGKLTTQCSLINHANKTQQGKLHRKISTLDGKIIFESNQSFDLHAGQSQLMAHTYDVKNELKKWDIGKPNLYLATDQVIINDKILDQRSTRFGYRTVTVEEENVLLNGRKIQLVGPWSHIGQWSWPAIKDYDIAESYRIMLKHGMNYGRLHGQPYPKIFYDKADEVGFLLVAETGLFHRPIANISLEHVRNMALTLRNHPSIVMWSGSNEFEHWITPRPPKTMAFLIKVYETFKATDPTRPVYHSAFGDADFRFDAYSIHYPEIMRTYPQGLLWKQYAPQRIKLLNRHTFTTFNPIGKKPILVGEHITPGRGRGMEAILGEEHLKLQYQSSKGYLQLLKNQGIIWRDMVRVYREQNIAMLSPNMMHIQTGTESPFLIEIGKELRGISCYIKERNPILITGTSQQRTLYVRDTDGWPDQGNVHVTIHANKKKLWKKTFPIFLESNQKHDQNLTLNLPTVSKPTLASLRVEFNDKGQNTPRYTWEQKIKLYPPTSHHVKLSNSLMLWQTNTATTASLLQTLNIKLQTVSQLPKSIQSKILLVDSSVKNSDLITAAKIVESHVLSGGQVLFLARKNLPEGLLPVAIQAVETDLPGLEAATIGFVRSPNHRLFQQSTIDTLDLRYWGKENELVSTQSLYKPTQGNFRVLIDSGEKLEDTLLLEILHGEGRYMICQMDVIKHAQQHPAASRLLGAILAELDQPISKKLHVGQFLSSTQSFTTHLLKRLGWQETNDLAHPTDSLIIDASALKRHGISRCIEMVRHTRVTIFKQLGIEQTQQIIDQLNLPELKANVLKKTIAKRKRGKVPKGVYLTEYPALLDGLDSNDVNWYQRLRPTSTVYHPNPNWQVPFSTGTLAIHQTKNQTIIFDASPWNQEVDLLDQRDRFLSTFWTNLGITVSGLTIRQRSTKNNYVQLDLSALCNTSINKYLGPNIQRGMVPMQNIPFRILPQTAQQLQTMIRLNGRVGSELENKPIMFDTPIDQFTLKTPVKMTFPMDRVHASDLYFAHASSQNWKIKSSNTGKVVYRVQVEYEDGSSQMIPMLMQRDINDCRSVSAQSRNSQMGMRVQNPKNGNGEVASIYISRWSNPYPERKIVKLHLVSAKNPPYDTMIFGITMRQADVTFE